jgi:hypothetical protein
MLPIANTGVRIAQSVQQRPTTWMTEEFGFDSWQKQDFSLLHGVETDSGAHSASYPMGTRGGGGFPQG